MGSRREGREAAVQFLFNRDLDPELTTEQFPAFFEFRRAKEEARDFAVSRIEGFLDRQPMIDKTISDALENFEFDRLAVVDRNILRVAVFEMEYDKDVPPPVAIDEAIEVARRLSTEDSARFVNGVLDRIAKA
ncbi:MAG: transcription antitermination factor NusB [Verrucomicrobiota bacterium]